MAKQRGRSWWSHPVVVCGALLLCFPVGLVLLWITPWRPWAKLGLTGLVVVAVLLVGLSGGTSVDTTAGVGSASSPSVPAPTTPPSPAPAPPPTVPAPPPTAPPPTAPPATTPPPAAAVTVADVVDGDTLETSDGATVRLIGIDTPERGQCGYREAGDALRTLTVGRPVALVPGARDDTDRYGRLLRYVEVDGADANYLMIASGRAVARYDSRDGYGRHPREDLYVAADAASASANACDAPATSVAPPAPAAGGATDPRFPSCTAAKAAGRGPYVRGQVEYGWYRDADGDGVVCE